MSDEIEMNGADLIKQERIRQIAVEGWTPEHDDKYTHGELWLAASCYIGLDDFEKAPELWPWLRKWWKPKDRISNLVRAGALIAAEIDRLQRLQAAIDGDALES